MPDNGNVTATESGLKNTSKNLLGKLQLLFFDWIKTPKAGENIQYFSLRLCNKSCSFKEKNQVKMNTSIMQHLLSSLKYAK